MEQSESNGGDPYYDILLLGEELQFTRRRGDSAVALGSLSQTALL